MTAMFGGFKQKSPRLLPRALEEYSDEYLQYCVEKDQVETLLEKTLHSSDDPREILDTTMKTVCQFYDGDWVGVMDVDMDTRIWSLICWYRIAGATDRTLERIREMEDGEVMSNWLDAIETGLPLVVPDASAIQESSPAEYAVYMRLGADSFIASPFSPAPTGFLVVRNPKRYLQHPEASFIFGYVLHRAIAQQITMAREESIEGGNAIEECCDVSISFFGDLKLRTAGGTLTEQQFNAPIAMPIIAYLLLKPERAHSPMEIFEHLYPDEVFDGDTNFIRGAIYRFTKAYTKSTGQKTRLIIRDGSGYRLNPAVKVTTDIQQFDNHIRAAGLVPTQTSRIDALKEAVELYNGPIFRSECDKAWIVDTVRHYEIKYIKAVELLLQEFAKKSDYSEIMHYASKAHELFPGNGIICYWLIAATLKNSGVAMAKKEYQRLREGMTSEENEVVVQHLTNGTALKYQDLFDT